MGIPGKFVLSPSKAVLVSLILLSATVWMDAWTRELSFTLIYLLPIGIVSWFSGRTSALAICILAAMGWFWIIYGVHLYNGPALWDTLTTLGLFLLFSYILSKLRTARDDLKKSADSLEMQVKERTSELADTNQELSLKNEALQRQTRQLRNLTFELARAEEQERRRIAHMLHDDLQQLLVAAKFSLQTAAKGLSSEAAGRDLNHAGALIDQSIAASRSLTTELVPPMLYEKGLSDALNWLADWIRQKHGIEIVIQSDEWKGQLDQDVLPVLFQCIRELLFNTVKHAHAKRAMITVNYPKDDTVAVRVQDEGVGFDPAVLEAGAGRKISGFGLLATRERLAMVGGRLTIESRPGRGTVGTIVMPARPEGPRVFSLNSSNSDSQ